MCSVMPPVTIDTPAKINLVLDVLGRREDGFHEIRSLMMSVGLCDRLVFEAAPAGVITLECEAARVPTDGGNLVMQAAHQLRERAARAAGCRVRLHKRIPVGGGMGGGSSDAAATLKVLNDLWGTGLSVAELSEIGGTIGSDVPFFFSPSGAIVSGRGERVRPVRLKWAGWVALVMTDVHVSTQEVYFRCTPKCPESHQAAVAELVEATTADALRPHLRNGLEDAVFALAPAVKCLSEELAELGAETMRVSGAGAVLFDLFDEEAQAQEFIKRARSCPHAKDAIAVAAPAPRE